MAKLYNTPGIAFTDKPEQYRETLAQNEMNPLRSVYRSLVNMGVANSTTAKEKKHTTITNFIAINSFIGSLVYLVIAIIWDSWFYFGSVAILTAASVATILLNSYHHNISARILYIVGINVAVFFNTLVSGSETGADSFLILAVVLPFIVFDIKKPAYIVCGVLLPMALLYSYSSTAPYFTQYNFNGTQQLLLKRVNILFEVGLLLSAVYQFLQYNSEIEEELEASNAAMMMQTSELKRSNGDLEQFAYIISHDLKTPVRNISSFMNLLVTKHGNSLNPEAKEFVTYSHSGAKRLERLIDDVLAYCRIGTNLSKPIPVNMNDVVNTLKFELREKTTAANANITIAKELPIVNNVHASLMYHILQNLINNGLKFNTTEAPEVTINWTNSLNHYTFSVSDNGIGISKEYSTTIFQMFKRLHNEHEYDGTGIGLAICKKIVEYYNGEIWFESEEGKGTTFFFSIRKF
jgi:signal transduction histidine kinase